jgi:hypothetical protein
VPRHIDQEELANKGELEITPEIKMIDHDEAMGIYREAITGALSQTYESNYAYDKAVQEKVRQLIDKVVIYPNDDPKGRDVVLTGDLESLFAPHSIGMKAMVPGGGIEPPTRGFSMRVTVG